MEYNLAIFNYDTGEVTEMESYDRKELWSTLIYLFGEPILDDSEEEDKK